MGSSENNEIANYPENCAFLLGMKKATRTELQRKEIIEKLCEWPPAQSSMHPPLVPYVDTQYPKPKTPNAFPIQLLDPLRLSALPLK